jgi:hypothetical protein
MTNVAHDALCALAAITRHDVKNADTPTKRALWTQAQGLIRLIADVEGFAEPVPTSGVLARLRDGERAL